MSSVNPARDTYSPGNTMSEFSMSFEANSARDNVPPCVITTFTASPHFAKNKKVPVSMCTAMPHYSISLTARKQRDCGDHLRQCFRCSPPHASGDESSTSKHPQTTLTDEQKAIVNCDAAARRTRLERWFKLHFDPSLVSSRQSQSAQMTLSINYLRDSSLSRNALQITRDLDWHLKP